MASSDDIPPILSEVEKPEFEPIPNPVITTTELENLLSKIATHLNETGQTIQKLQGEDPETFTADNLKDRIPEPVVSGSMPILSTIKLATDIEQLEETDSDYSIENRITDIIHHETLHIILYHIEGREASIMLDNIANSNEGL